MLGNLQEVNHWIIAQDCTTGKQEMSHSFNSEEFWSSTVAEHLNSETSPHLRQNWRKHLKKGKMIASGAFGDVFLGKWANLPENIQPPRVVIKELRLRLQYGQSDSLPAKKLDKQGRREVAIWRNLRHENIVPLLGILHSPDSEAVFPPMVMPYMPSGTLREYVRTVTDVDYNHLLLGTARGLEYLHTFEMEGVIHGGVIHGDLKAVNVLMDSDGTPRITDFGLSKILSDESLWVTSAMCPGGSLGWMAPELLDGSQIIPTKESDIYALAMLAIEVLTSEVPFAADLDSQVLGRVVFKNEFPLRPRNADEKLWRLLVGCWARSSQNRPRVTNIVTRIASWK